MAMLKPQFYLVSAETVPIIGPRACHIQQKLSPLPIDDYPPGYEWVLVKIEPRLYWETGLRTVGTIDTEELVLAQRSYGPTGLVDPIYPISDWPEWVNAFQILNDDIKRTGKASAQDLRHILIAELWPTAEEAEKMIRSRLAPHVPDLWI